MSGEFVDTNVLLYAHDASAGSKRTRAAALLERLSAERRGLLSSQVLMEFYVAATRKLPKRLDHRTATAIVDDFGTWPVFSPAVSDILGGARLAERHRIHFWDGMVVRAALALGAEIIWSEDLNPGQSYARSSGQEPVRVVACISGGPAPTPSGGRTCSPRVKKLFTIKP